MSKFRIYNPQNNKYAKLFRNGGWEWFPRGTSSASTYTSWRRAQNAINRMRKNNHLFNYCEVAEFSN